MPLNAGTAFIDLQPQLGAGFAGQVQGLLGGPAISKGALAAGTGIGLAVGAGIAAVNIGETFDDAFDTIRLGTGAIGPDLEALKTEFKDVFASIPTDADLAAIAIADLNTRTGATGDALEALARQELELARITGADVGRQIETTTRLFGDWGIATEDQAGTLDKLWRASQSTGAGIDQLADSAVRFGSPLRQLGFGLDETLGLLGKFEQEGVNTDLVMGSLRIALGNLARSGEDPIEGFQRLVEEIENTADAGEATGKAIDLFGARAGPDMAAAIREGRFELGDLLNTITNGEETIAAAVDDTDDWRQSWQQFKNKALVAIEPIVTRFFEALGRFMDWAGPAVERFGEIIGTVFGFISDLFGGLRGEAGSTESAFGGLTSRLGPMFETLGGILNSVIEVIKGIFDGLRAFWEQWGETIMTHIGFVFDNIGAIIGGALDVIKGIFDVILGILTGDWSRAWDGIKNIVGAVWDVIKTLVGNAFGAVLNIVTSIGGKVWSALTGAFTRAKDAVVDIIKKLPGALLGIITGIPSMFLELGKNIVGSIVKGLGNIVGSVKDKITGGISKAIDGVKSFFGFGSPSRVMAEELGAPLGQGIAVGIAATSSDTARAFTDVITGGADAGAAAVTRSLTNLPKFNVPSSSALAGSALNAAAGALGATPAGGAGINIELADGAIVVNNPEPEPASTSIPRELRRLERTLGRS